MLIYFQSVNKLLLKKVDQFSNGWAFKYKAPRRLEFMCVWVFWKDDKTELLNRGLSTRGLSVAVNNFINIAYEITSKTWKLYYTRSDTTAAQIAQRFNDYIFFKMFRNITSLLKPSLKSRVEGRGRSACGVITKVNLNFSRGCQDGDVAQSSRGLELCWTKSSSGWGYVSYIHKAHCQKMRTSVSTRSCQNLCQPSALKRMDGD